MLKRESFIWWKGLPETKAVQEVVAEFIKDARLQIVKNIGVLEDVKVKAAILDGMERAMDFEDLFNFKKDDDATKDGGTQVVDQAEARRSTIRGQY